MTDAEHAELLHLRRQAVGAVPLTEAIAWHDVAIALHDELLNVIPFPITSMPPAVDAYSAARNGRYEEATAIVASLGLDLRPTRPTPPPGA